MSLSNANAKNSLKLTKKTPIEHHGTVLRFWNTFLLKILADSFQADESLGVHPIVALSARKVLI